MHVLHVVPTGGWAGTEQMVANMANRTIDSAKVTVVVRDGPNAPRAMVRSRFDPRVDVIFTQKGATPGAQAESVAEQLATTPDIVHAHLRPGAELARALELDAPVVAHLHVRYFSAHFWWADALVCVSPWQARDVPESFPGPVYLVPNWVEPFDVATEEEQRRFRRQCGVGAGGLLVGAIGRLSEEKAFDVLCRAFANAADQKDRLVIVGDGPCREDLDELAQVDERIVLAGYRAESRRLLGAIDVFASSSRLESFGMSVLEAMTVRLPIVATRARGVQDLLSGTSARLVDIDDVDGLSHELAETLDSVRRGDRQVEYPLDQYEPAACARRLCEVYDHVLGRVGRADSLVRPGRS
jgi:glycosyltransferase involved in cell wall biosynthesis